MQRQELAFEIERVQNSLDKQQHYQTITGLQGLIGKCRKSELDIGVSLKKMTKRRQNEGERQNHFG